MKMYLNPYSMPQQAAVLGSFGVKDIRKRLWNLSLRLRKAAEGRHELEMSLNRGPREAIV